MNEPLVYVVIPNWEHAEDTIACVRSVEADGYPHVRVLVVDNGSADNSVDRISAACPEAALIALEENLGFAGGSNAGIDSAVQRGAELVLLLNNDTIVVPGSIAALVRALTEDRTWSIAVPKICFHDEPDRIWAAGCRWRRFPPQVKMIGFGKRDAPRYNYAQELLYATGCALLVRRSVFEDVRGFDPRFKNYQEDYDFCYRARQAGHRLVYVHQATVLHKVAQSLGETSPIRWHYLGRNTVLFYRPGERFSWGALFSSVVWTIVRETVKGNVARVPAFVQGVLNGIGVFRSEREWR
jgi:GT2 family glycosyltransferase